MFFKRIFKKGGEFMFHKKGFTLIELLIVVAIIAILAAIAVPNFLEAQVRSKVSRARADMRSLATGLEAYAVEWRDYPFTEGSMHIPPALSTPIAFITSKDWVDPFNIERGTLDERTYRYINWKYVYIVLNNLPAIYNQYRTVYGEWRLTSDGPDRTFGPAQATPPGLWNCVEIYDSTNGTMSAGDIIRCQKFSGDPDYNVTP